jgi:GAF domain-containing protein
LEQAGNGLTDMESSPRRGSSTDALDEQHLRQLLDAGRALVERLDLEAILDRLLDTARDITGARYAALGILDASRRELERFVTRGIDEETHRTIGDLPRGRGILGLLIDDPRPLRLGEIGDHPRSYGFPPSHPPMHSFLGVPVMIRGQAWGNLYLTEKEGGVQFDDTDEQTAVTLAEWAAVAVENARLYSNAEARRAELERAVRSLEATTAIARAVGGETELERILELIVKRGRALVSARALTIMLGRGRGPRPSVARAGDRPRDGAQRARAPRHRDGRRACRPARIPGARAWSPLGDRPR